MATSRCPAPPLTDDLDLTRVLAAYAAADELRRAEAAAAAPQAPSSQPDAPPAAGEATERDSDIGWVPRLAAIGELTAAALAPLHGRLIAEGLLQFTLLGRSEGVGYRLTPQGRQHLRGPGTTDSTTDDEMETDRQGDGDGDGGDIAEAAEDSSLAA